MSKWDKYEEEEIVSDSTNKWDKYEEEESEIESPDISKTETALRAGLQGATLGFADEAAGAIGAVVKSPLDSLMQYIPGTSQATDKDLREQGFTGAVDQKSILDQYKESRDLVRADNKASEEANPNTYLAGEIAGGVLPALASGGGTALAAAGKTGLKQLAKQGAKEGLKFGAAQAAGISESDLTEGDIEGLAKDTAIGAGLGVTMGAALPVGIGSIKKVSSKAKEILKGIGKGTYDKSVMARHVTEAVKAAAKGLTIIGDKGVSSVKKSNLNKMAKYVSKVTKRNRKEANKMIEDALKDGDESTRRMLDKIIKEQVDEIDKIARKASSEEGKAGAQAFKNEMKALKERQLKEGVDPRILDLPTESEALGLLKKKQTQQLAAQSPDILAKKAEIQLQNKLARKGDVPEDTLLGLDPVELPQGASREVLTAATPEKELGRQLIKPGKISPIEKVAVDDSQFLRYDLDGQVKTQQFQPKDILKDEPPKVQDFFDLVQNFKESIPEGGNVARELADIQVNLRKQISEALPVEKAQLLEEGFDRLNDVHAIRSKLGKDIGSQFSSKEQAATAKLGDDLEQLHGFSYKNRGEGKEQLSGGLDIFSKLNPEGKALKSRVSNTAQRLELSEQGQGISNIKLEGFAGASIKVGAGIGHFARKLGLVSKNNLAAASKKAAQDGNKPASNFLKALAYKNPQAKSAAIFSASQNPELKESLGRYFDLEED